MKRKRIKREPKVIEVVDPLEFKSNCASKNAQHIHTYDELKVELWCDKHYFHRRNHGDEQGKREGIDIEDVTETIIEGFKYLLDIHLRGIPFKFINYFDTKNPAREFYRIVLKRNTDNGLLNVVCEIHYLDTSKFEITVVTAMVEDKFKMSEGQYALRIFESESILSRNIRHEINRIYTLKK